jgi:ABC-type lipoprotein export system ATPase subunit
VQALNGVSVSVPAGQFLCVMGPSGSGKSTLLHLLAGLERPSSGGVWIGDTEVHKLSQNEAARFRRRNVGLIFQFFNLIPSLSVEENVALSLLLEGKRLAQVQARIEPVLSALEIGHRRHHAPCHLSGGEMQRVAIARALVTDPALLLADEPTGNLDRKAGEQVLSLLRRSCDERGVTTILVTHDLQAASYAERVLVLRDGRIEDDVPADRLGRLR